MLNENETNDYSIEREQSPFNRLLNLRCVYIYTDKKILWKKEKIKKAQMAKKSNVSIRAHLFSSYVYFSSPFRS